MYKGQPSSNIHYARMCARAHTHTYQNIFIYNQSDILSLTNQTYYEYTWDN